LKKKIFLCSISNIVSGTCLEDCKFCTQSVRYGAEIDRYSRKDIDSIVEEAKRASSIGALGFCLVTAGKGLNSKTLDYMLEVTEAVKSATPNLNLIACNGTATVDQLKELKKAGISSYNHNLESSREYYKNICSTHTWDERFETCENVKDVGLKLCTGGILGMGESSDDRDSFLKSIESLNPESVPLNFYHHNPALPLKPNPLSIEEGLSLIKETRNLLGEEKRVMVAGGRESFFKDRWIEIFEAGANSIVIGDYLTVAGDPVQRDIEKLKESGYEIANRC
jgi:biotin synthase